jgi:hypothetical protein
MTRGYGAVEKLSCSPLYKDDAEAITLCEVNERLTLRLPEAHGTRKENQCSYPPGGSTAPLVRMAS